MAQTIIATDEKNASFAIFLYEDPTFFSMFSNSSIGFSNGITSISPPDLQQKNVFRIDGECNR